ncbi:hypothetical protein RRG08_041706, partial [Elysia crispata]
MIVFSARLPEVPILCLASSNQLTPIYTCVAHSFPEPSAVLLGLAYLMSRTHHGQYNSVYTD